MADTYKDEASRIFCPQHAYITAAADEELWTNGMSACSPLAIVSADAARRLLCHVDNVPTGVFNQTLGWLQWATSNGTVACTAYVMADDKDALFDETLIAQNGLAVAFDTAAFGTSLGAVALTAQGGIVKYPAYSDDTFSIRFTAIDNLWQTVQAVTAQTEYTTDFLLAYETGTTPATPFDWQRYVSFIAGALQDFGLATDGITFWPEALEGELGEEMWSKADQYWSENIRPLTEGPPPTDPLLGVKGLLEYYRTPELTAQLDGIADSYKYCLQSALMSVRAKGT